jgi:hypothetical protein
MSWDVSVYGGIRKFQKTKGFDPYSQEAALELGYPLFHLSCDRDALFAHSTHIELCIYAAASHGLTVHQSANGDCYQDSNGVSYTEDCSEDEDEQYGCAVDCQTMNSITHHLKCRFGQLRAWEHFPGSECSEWFILLLWDGRSYLRARGHPLGQWGSLWNSRDIWCVCRSNRFILRVLWPKLQYHHRVSTSSCVHSLDSFLLPLLSLYDHFYPWTISDLYAGIIPIQFHSFSQLSSLPWPWGRELRKYKCWK